MATWIAASTLILGAVALRPAFARVLRDATLTRIARATPRSPLLGTTNALALRSSFLRPAASGPRVGVQVGHWKMEEAPPELGRLRDATGAQAGSVREVDVNLAIGRELAGMLESAGMAVDLLPVVVPPGYSADAFVSIHADGAARSGARGWKIAAPWRASPASILLERSVAEIYGRITGLPEDPYGVTYGMKGYYAFSPQRVRYAVSPLTPCIIVETGFVTVAADREVIVRQPEVVAQAIASGLIRYLASRPSPYTHAGRMAFVPVTYPIATVTVPASALRAGPAADAPEVTELQRGTAVLPMQMRGDWAEVVVRGNFRSFGWVRAQDIRPQG